MSRAVAFLDFDGTITNKDSLLEFIRYSKGKAAFYLGFALHAPFVIAYKLKLLSNQRFKEMILRYFYNGMTVEEFTKYCADFSRDVLPSLIRPKAVKEIHDLKNAGVEVVIVSASPKYWLHYWCGDMNIGCIATHLLIHDNRITGKIDGVNCYGEEKVTRIRMEYDLDTFSSVYCYGDTPGDKPMLALGTIRFYKPFR